MKLAIALLFSASTLLAQGTTDPDPGATTKPDDTAGATTTTPADDTTTTGGETTAASSSAIGGFDGVQWGTKYADVKEKFRVLATNPDVTDPVEIVNDVPNRELTIRRKDIIYRYAFYMKPRGEKAAEATAAPAEGEATAEEDISRMFFVEVNFHLIDTEQLYKKLSQKYGQRTNSTLDKRLMRGAYFWNTDDGALIQWIEPFNVKPYSRRIVYVSNKIRKDIEKDLQEYRFARELEDLKNILPDAK